MSDNSADDPAKNTAGNAVDRASSKTPLDDDAHIDPAKARESVERQRAAKQTTSKSEGGSAPVKAKPNAVREKDDREKEPISEETRDLSAQEQAKNSSRER